MTAAAHSGIGIAQRGIDDDDLHPHVLVVDDDEVIRQFVIAALLEDGYRANGAPHGVAALDYLDGLAAHGRAQPDLILLDMRMPVMDGWAFARTYRQRPVDHAPLVIITAAADAAARAAQIAADGVVAKPFDLDHLVALVKEYTRTPAT